MTTYCAIPSPDGPTLIHPRQYTCDERCKPVLVIDPEDREDAAAVMKAMTEMPPKFNVGLNINDRAAVDEVWITHTQTALRSLITPTKPPRPGGWGAVVEDNTGAYWTLIAPEADAWRNYREGARPWSEITAVRVLSEGVTA